MIYLAWPQLKAVLNFARDCALIRQLLSLRLRYELHVFNLIFLFVLLIIKYSL